MSEFGPAMLAVMRHECTWPIADVGGGFVDDPNDSGGPTVYGLSKVIRLREGLTPEDFEIQDFTNDSLKTVRREVAERIFKRIYWDRYRYGLVENQDVATKIFDAAVNLNPPAAAHRIAQRACTILGAQLLEDGVFGARTIVAINGEDSQCFLRGMVDGMILFYEECIRRNPRNEAHRSNWMHRARWTHF